MAIQKVLVINSTTGVREQYTPIDTSAGTASAGAIAALSADGKWNANMIPGTIGQTSIEAVVVGGTIGVGKFVNITNDGTVAQAQLADCTDGTKPANGFCLVGGTNTETVTVYLEGRNDVIASAIAVTDIGDRIFLSTAGGVTLTPPATTGNYMQVLGQCLAADGTTTSLEFEAAEGVIM
jgi:hypothetical protein